jgi:hypothetical protein
MPTIKKIQSYGCPEKGHSQKFYDRWAFANYQLARNAPLRHVLFRKVADQILPGHFEWHAWTLRMVEALCNNTWVGVSGCSSAAKTYNIAGFAVVAWLCDPYNTSVIFCSTTTKAQKQKAWGKVQEIHRKLTEDGEPFGNMIGSQMIWEFVKGDSMNAMLVKAVTDGDVNKAAQDIAGHHTKNQMVVIDEAEATAPAIWKAAANLYSYPEQAGGWFLLAAVANARSRLTNFGRFIEPATGWSSVSPENDDWNGKPQLDGRPTKVVIFNFNRSPNVLEKRQVSKHLPTVQRVAMRMKTLRDRGMENDADHWCYDLGFPAPEGISKTPFTETLLEKFEAYKKHQFAGSNFLIIGVVDPAYTPEGDRPALRFGAVGDLADGKKGIEWCEPIVLSIDAASPEPPRYQLLSQIRRHCGAVEYRGQKYTCEPKNFGIDVTGDAGLADIAKIEWSPEIISIMYQGSADDSPCSHEDPRPAVEVYANMRAQMFYLTQLGVMSGQIKGIDKDTASELCSIEEIDQRSDGTMRPRKTLMSKKAYRLKFQKSCDFADSGIMLTEVARQKGFVIAATGQTMVETVDTDMRVNQINMAQEGADYSPQNEAAQWQDEEEYAYADAD